MITRMDRRKYTLRKRAAQQDETRLRIVEATMALHEELGPRQTTISAIAERAGVQRLTVYRHFGDEATLFQACTACWLERHPPPPPPPPATMAAAPDAPSAEAATREGLHALYRYYAGTRRMWEVSYRDVDLVPALQGPMQGVADYLAAYRDALAAAWPAQASQALRATLALALRFTTWQALADQGLDDAAMAGLVARWAAAAAAEGGR
jgi:AcrR family transcriptional regulator